MKEYRTGAEDRAFQAHTAQIDHAEELPSHEGASHITVSRLTRENADELPEYVAFLRDRLPEVPRDGNNRLEDALQRNTLETFTDRLNNPNYFLYAGRDPEGNLVAVSFGQIRSKEGVSEKYRTVGHFGLTLVHPEHRGMRIGGKLKEAFEQDCARRDVPMMTTFVTDINPASRRMNERMGMKPVTDDPVLVPMDGGRYYAKPTPRLKTA